MSKSKEIMLGDNAKAVVSDEPRISKVIIEYTDGTKKEVNKAVVSMLKKDKEEEDLDEYCLKSEICNMKSEEVNHMLVGFVFMANNFGVLLPALEMIHDKMKDDIDE